MKVWLGGSGDDVLVGAAEENRFEPGVGANVIVGGDQRDTVVINGTTSIAIYAYGSGIRTSATEPYSANTISTGAGDDTVLLSRISGIDPGAPEGSAARQWVFAGAGDDRVEISAPSAAWIFGGEGEDVIIKTDLRTDYDWLVDGSDVIYADAADPPDDVGQDVAWSDADMIFGGAGNDSIATGDGPDWVDGGDGDDRIELGAGENRAFGGSGDDVLSVSGIKVGLVTSQMTPEGTFGYSYSVDAIYGGAGNDAIEIANVRGGNLGISVHGDVGDDSIRIETVDGSLVTGGDGNDVILCVAAPAGWSKPIILADPADVVFGGAGDDSIDTGRGPDLIVAGDGFDTIAAGLGDDRIFLAGGSGGDRATDRLVVDDPRDSFFGIPSGWSSDMVFDFQPLSRMGADSAGQADKIDLTALLQAYDASGVAAGDSRYYSAANPFDAGHLRLTAVGGSTRVEINDPAAGWRSFLTLVGVGSDELSTTVQADLSSGLAAASGGDFLWYVG